jgi:hypothetical protein
MHRFTPTATEVHTTLRDEPKRDAVIQDCTMDCETGETKLRAEGIPPWRWVYALHHGNEERAKVFMDRAAVLDKLRTRQTVYSNAQVLAVDGEDIGLLRQLTRDLDSEEAGASWARRLKERNHVLAQ